MNKFIFGACAKLVLAIGEFMSSVTADEEGGGRLPFVGSERISLHRRWSSHVMSLTFELVALLCILMGGGWVSRARWTESRSDFAGHHGMRGTLMRTRQGSVPQAPSG